MQCLLIPELVKQGEVILLHYIRYSSSDVDPWRTGSIEFVYKSMLTTIYIYICLYVLECLNELSNLHYHRITT